MRKGSVVKGFQKDLPRRGSSENMTRNIPLGRVSVINTRAFTTSIMVKGGIFIPDDRSSDACMLLLLNLRDLLILYVIMTVVKRITINGTKL